MYYLIIILGVAIDQATKFLARTYVGTGNKIAVIDNFFYLTYHKNNGAVFGLLQNFRVMFIVTTVILLFVLFYMLAKSYNRMLRFSVAIIISGAIGNFIDRCIGDGGVTDFLDFYFWSYNFPTFNVADSLISCGSVLLIIYLLFFYKEGDLNIKFLNEDRDKIRKKNKDE